MTAPPAGLKQRSDDADEKHGGVILHTGARGTDKEGALNAAVIAC